MGSVLLTMCIEYWTSSEKVMLGELSGNAAYFFLADMQEYSLLYHVLAIPNWVQDHLPFRRRLGHTYHVRTSYHYLSIHIHVHTCVCVCIYI